MIDIPPIMKAAKGLASGAERLAEEALKIGERTTLASPAVLPAKEQIGIILTQSNTESYAVSMLEAGQSWKNMVAAFFQATKSDSSSAVSGLNRELAARFNTTSGIWQNFSKNPNVRIPTLTDMSMSWDLASRGVYNDRTMTLRPDVMMQNVAGISRDVISTGTQIVVQNLMFNRLADLKSIPTIGSAQQIEELATAVGLSPASAEHFLAVRGGRPLDREAAKLAESFENGFANMPSAADYTELLKRRHEIDGMETVIKGGADPFQPIKAILDPGRGPRLVEILFGKPRPGEPDHYANLVKKYGQAFRPSSLGEEEAAAHVTDDLMEARQKNDRELNAWFKSYSSMPHALWGRERAEMVTEFFSRHGIKAETETASHISPIKHEVISGPLN